MRARKSIRDNCKFTEFEDDLGHHMKAELSVEYVAPKGLIEDDMHDAIRETLEAELRNKIKKMSYTDMTEEIISKENRQDHLSKLRGTDIYFFPDVFVPEDLIICNFANLEQLLTRNYAVYPGWWNR